MSAKKQNLLITLFLALILLFFCGCSLTAPRDTPVLFYENNELLKAYAKEKEEVLSPDVQSDPGYCPVCEL